MLDIRGRKGYRRMEEESEGSAAGGQSRLVWTVVWVGACQEVVAAHDRLGN